MTQRPTDISIVIVNYKVKEYIANLLNSIEKAKGSFKLQIIVIDNNSGDDSIPFLKNRYPEVTYIENKENLGFGKANNQGIHIAEGTYTLLINPDTLVSEDTFSVLFEHMEENSVCGAAGCKILNPDGTFAKESKRAVPGVWNAVCTVLGLHVLFPKSKVFAERYLGWMNEDEFNEVPVISGACMFWRTAVLHELDGFDERFFMYAEDDDLCYRIKETDYEIHYVPETSIIHYKGESARKGDLRYIRIFNRALYQFFDKHYSSKYSFLFRVLILTAVWIKTGLSFITSNFKTVSYITSDLVLLNLSVILGFLIRFKFSYEVFSNLQNFKFLWINLLISLIYVFIGGLLDLFRSQKDSISNQLKAIVGSYAGVALVTFFVRNYAFSRLALIIGMVSALVMMLIFKIIQINVSKTNTKVTGRLKTSRILIVGKKEDTRTIRDKIHSRPDWNYEVSGLVTLDEVDEEALGVLSQLGDLVKAYHIDQVFFALKSISYKDMLKQISLLQSEGVLFKLIPDSMDFILGKSNVEYLESIPLVEVDFEYSKGVNKLTKRVMDLLIAVPVWFILFGFTFPSLMVSNRKKQMISGIKLYTDYRKNRLKNLTILYWNIVIGKLSLVGAPFFDALPVEYESARGITGLRQINRHKIHSREEAENYELYYLQNYSIWVDIDIMLKTIFNGVKVFPENESE